MSCDGDIAQQYGERLCSLMSSCIEPRNKLPVVYGAEGSTPTPTARLVNTLDASTLQPPSQRLPLIYCEEPEPRN